MTHIFLDKYSDLDSPVHRLDPRVKLVIAFAFVLAVVTTPPGLWPVFALYLVLLWGVILLAKLPPLFILLRSLVIIPFTFVVAVSIPFLGHDSTAGSYSLGPWQIAPDNYGLVVLWNVVVKSWLSVQALTILSSTSGFQDLLLGLRGLGMPKAMIMILSFMYRYTFVLVEEALRMRRARDSRNFGGKRLWQWKTVGNIVGSLFIRSYERGERVYMAMLARGFDGEVRSLSRPKLRTTDIYWCAACLGVIVAVDVVLRFLSPI